MPTTQRTEASRAGWWRHRVDMHMHNMATWSHRAPQPCRMQPWSAARTRTRLGRAVRTAYRVPRTVRTAYTVWHPTGGAGQALLLRGTGAWHVACACACCMCMCMLHVHVHYLPTTYLLTTYYLLRRSSTRPLSCCTCARGNMCYSAHSGRWCVALFLTLNVSTHECTHAPIHQCTNA